MPACRKQQSTGSLIAISPKQDNDKRLFLYIGFSFLFGFSGDRIHSPEQDLIKALLRRLKLKLTVFVTELTDIWRKKSTSCYIWLLKVDKSRGGSCSHVAAKATSG